MFIIRYSLSCSTICPVLKNNSHLLHCCAQLSRFLTIKSLIQINQPAKLTAIYKISRLFASDKAKDGKELRVSI